MTEQGWRSFTCEELKASLNKCMYKRGFIDSWSPRTSQASKSPHLPKGSRRSWALEQLSPKAQTLPGLSLLSGSVCLLHFPSMQTSVAQMAVKLPRTASMAEMWFRVPSPSLVKSERCVLLFQWGSTGIACQRRGSLHPLKVFDENGAEERFLNAVKVGCVGKAVTRYKAQVSPMLGLVTYVNSGLPAVGCSISAGPLGWCSVRYEAGVRLCVTKNGIMGRLLKPVSSA